MSWVVPPNYKSKTIDSTTIKINFNVSMEKHLRIQNIRQKFMARVIMRIFHKLGKKINYWILNKIFQWRHLVTHEPQKKFPDTKLINNPFIETMSDFLIIPFTLRMRTQRTFCCRKRREHVFIGIFIDAHRSCGDRNNYDSYCKVLTVWVVFFYSCSTELKSLKLIRSTTTQRISIKKW